MNPRQRRGVLLMIVAGIGAVAIFAAVWAYTNALREDLGEMRTVVRVAEDVNAYDPVTPDALDTTEVPAGYFEDTFVEDPGEVVPTEGQQVVASTNLEEGALLQESMLMDAPELDAGEREIAIMVDAETGVAGKVDRGSLVDIYATYDGGTEEPPCAVRVLTEVEVLDIGDITAEAEDETGVGGNTVPVTFRLSPEDTLQLTFAESFSIQLRLGLISPQGAGSEPEEMEFCSDTDVEEFFEDAEMPDHEDFDEEGPDTVDEDEDAAEDEDEDEEDS